MTTANPITTQFGSYGKARKAFADLTPTQITAHLNAFKGWYEGAEISPRREKFVTDTEALLTKRAEKGSKATSQTKAGSKSKAKAASAAPDYSGMPAALQEAIASWHASQSAEAKAAADEPTFTATDLMVAGMGELRSLAKAHDVPGKSRKALVEGLLALLSE